MEAKADFTYCVTKCADHKTCKRSIALYKFDNDKNYSFLRGDPKELDRCKYYIFYRRAS